MSQIFAAAVVGRERHADHSLDFALNLSNVTFRWAFPVDFASGGDEKKLSTDTKPDVPEYKPEGFSLDNLDLTVPRGLLVALVGRVGSGKSSLLQGVSGSPYTR